MTVLRELRKFQEDRLLHKQEFNLRVASMNIIEELLEAHGVHESKERNVSDKVYREMLMIVDKVDTSIAYGAQMEAQIVPVGWDDFVDAFCDIQVFAGGEVGKLGYDNEKALTEVSKEINSREGAIINGKFVKEQSLKAQAKWYKADFDKAKLSEKRSISYDICVDEVSAEITLTIDETKFGHSIKFTDEVDENEAIIQLVRWKELMIEV